MVKKGEEKGFQGEVQAPERVSAPIARGQSLGHYVVTRNGAEVLRVPLVAASDVPRMTFTQQIGKTLRSVIK